MNDPRTEALAERGLKNHVVASGIWARASGGSTWSYPGLNCFMTTVPRRGFNQAILDTNAPPSNEDIRDAIDRFDKTGLRYRVRVRDVIDDVVRSRLESVGLVHRGGIPAMVFDGRLPEARPTNLRIEEVCDKEILADNVLMVAEAFAWEPAQLAEVFQPALLGEPGWFGFVGYEGGTPVAASQLITHDGTGGLYYVAVHSRYRRKGYGEAITRAAVEKARTKGCDLVVLTASPDGYPVYQHLGFREAGKHIGYTPHDEDE
jgi:ribosomal protein S18 acetylase RimI-like enzyme